MYDHDLFVSTLSDFVRTLVEPYDTDTVLDDLAASVRETLHLTGAGVSLAEDGRIRMATVIPPHLVLLENYQEEHQTGPSVDAFRESRAVVVSDADELRARWPGYAALAIECGTHAVAALPLALSGRTFGTLTMYAESREWPEPDLAAASLFGGMATAYLVHESVHQQQQQLNSQLTHALESRIVIEQAKGILAEAHGETVETAFERIRSHARSHSVKVRDVSEAIVRMGLRL
ncbi:GAF domain-containing protein [Georgenia soli]|uniref:GAF domain-containing protein n=1 Tax=Georgenia soli TaxID=638953 RepID=A0A2A9EK41_9MICO|nr:GAF and ANTAR domain-containing protein [Georgenia soli]PFG38600.1 GAF domain-containing protein [Georgenia soli]